MHGNNIGVAQTNITFTDIAPLEESGISYNRIRSPREALFDEIKQTPPFVITETPAFVAIKGRGTPGVVLFDYDNDGDLDMYVTNGPGKVNSLYVNQLKETGTLTFIDLGEESGVGAITFHGLSVLQERRN